MNNIISVNTITRRAIPTRKTLGVQGENKVENLVFTLGESLGECTATLDLVQNGQKYTLNATNFTAGENNTFVLQVKNSLLRYAGVLQMQFLLYKNNNVVFKSSMFEMLVEESIEGTSSIPDEYNLWQSVMENNVEDLQEDVGDLQNTKQDKIPGKGLSENDYSDDEKEKVADNTTFRHTHNNKALLDTYGQTEENLEDAVNKKHEHSNKTVLDDTTASFIIEEKEKLEGIKANADVNLIEKIKKNGTELPIQNKAVDISIPTKTSDLNNDSGFIIKEVNNLTNYLLKSSTGALIDLTINPATFEMTLKLKNADGTVLDTKTIDLPLETMVVSASYANGTLTLTLQNGQTLDIDISDIISGLVPDSREIAGLDLQNDITKAELQTALEISTFITTALAGYYTKTEVNTELNKKEDKVPGKGLSTNDYTLEEKTKLAGIAENANNYTLPPADNVTLGGIKVGNGLEISADGTLSTGQATGHVYGIRRRLDATTSSWERTDDAVGLVANATKNGSAVQNDFDNLSPWKDIITYNLNRTTGKINAFYNEPEFEFDGSNGDVYTRCPDVYYKVWKDSIYKYIQIADYAKTGFTKCNNFSTMRYHAGLVDGELRSYSGLIPAFYRTLPQFRTLAQAAGSGYCLLDWRYFVLQLLYLVEYADYDSQSKLGKGFTSLRVSDQDKPLVAETAANRIIVSTTVGNALIVGQQIAIGSFSEANIRTITAKNSYSEGDITGIEVVFDGDAKDIAVTTGVWSSPQKAGSCDILGMRSGCLANDGKHDMTYRGHEGFIGNVYDFLDGLNITDNQGWICYDPAEYASDKFEVPYEPLGYVNANANGYIKDLGLDPNHPLIQLPIQVGGASNTYVSDYYYQNTGNRVTLVGGGVSNGTSTGLWCWFLGDTSSTSAWLLGARLIKYQ